MHNTSCAHLVVSGVLWFPTTLCRPPHITSESRLPPSYQTTITPWAYTGTHSWGHSPSPWVAIEPTQIRLSFSSLRERGWTFQEHAWWLLERRLLVGLIIYIHNYTWDWLPIHYHTQGLVTPNITHGTDTHKYHTQGLVTPILHMGLAPTNRYTHMGLTPTNRYI